MATETLRLNKNNLGADEAKVLGNFNVMGYDTLNELTSASRLPRGTVEKQVSSLILRGMVTAAGTGWRELHLPSTLMTNQDSKPIREVFHAIDRLYDVIRMEANVNIDHGLSDALDKLSIIAQDRAKRHGINIASNWKPPIAVNKMIVVAEVTKADARRIQRVISEDARLNQTRDTAGSRKRNPNSFEAAFASLDKLDAVLRKEPGINMDYGFSGALYGLTDVVADRQARFTERTPNRNPSALDTKIIVHEANEYSSWARVNSIIRKETASR